MRTPLGRIALLLTLALSPLAYHLATRHSTDEIGAKNVSELGTNLEEMGEPALLDDSQYGFSTGQPLKMDSPPANSIHHKNLERHPSSNGKSHPPSRNSPKDLSKRVIDVRGQSKGESDHPSSNDINEPSQPKRRNKPMSMKAGSPLLHRTSLRRHSKRRPRELDAAADRGHAYYQKLQEPVESQPEHSFHSWETLSEDGYKTKQEVTSESEELEEHPQIAEYIADVFNTVEAEMGDTGRFESGWVSLDHILSHANEDNAVKHHNLYHPSGMIITLENHDVFSASIVPDQTHLTPTPRIHTTPDFLLLDLEHVFRHIERDNICDLTYVLRAAINNDETKTIINEVLQYESLQAVDPPGHKLYFYPPEDSNQKQDSAYALLGTNEGKEVFLLLTYLKKKYAPNFNQELAHIRIFRGPVNGVSVDFMLFTLSQGEQLPSDRLSQNSPASDHIETGEEGPSNQASNSRLGPVRKGGKSKRMAPYKRSVRQDRV
jgi:hypothetical protein